MSESQGQAAKDSQAKPEVGEVTVDIQDAKEAKEFFREFDELQRFRLEVASEFFEKISNLADAGTGLYEKIILLNGAIIALSITFIGSLSSRMASAHLVERPHLWMVGISWFLLIVSVYASYRVILDRHSATYRLLAAVSTEHTRYLYQRMGISFTRLGKLAKGKISVGEKNIDFTEFVSATVMALELEGEAGVKRMEEFVTEGKKTYNEGRFARVAVRCTILAVAILCAFTVLSLRLLF